MGEVAPPIEARVESLEADIRQLRYKIKLQEEELTHAHGIFSAAYRDLIKRTEALEEGLGWR